MDKWKVSVKDITEYINSFRKIEVKVKNDGREIKDKNN